MTKAILSIFAGALVCGFSLSAAETNSIQHVKRVVMTAEEDALFRMKLFGGMVRKENSGRGRILIVNAQSKVGTDEAEDNFTTIRSFMKLPVEFSRGEYPAKPCKAAVQAAKANFVIWIVYHEDCENDLTIVPDSHWAVVNVAALDDDEPTMERLESRVAKMVMRAFALLCGAANSANGRTVTSSISKYVDLDKVLYAGLPIDRYQSVIDYLHAAKVDPYIETTYANACQEGWAPQPTNEYQKAIWDKVHAIPSKPIKIEFNEKRDKGK